MKKKQRKRVEKMAAKMLAKQMLKQQAKHDKPKEDEPKQAKEYEPKPEPIAAAVAAAAQPKPEPKTAPIAAAPPKTLERGGTGYLRRDARRAETPPAEPPPELEKWWKDWIASRKIELTWEGTREELEYAAYKSQCEHRAQRNLPTDPMEDCDPPTMHRWMINYVRHHHSNYARTLRGDRSDAVKEALRDRFNAAISVRYDIPLSSVERRAVKYNPVRNVYDFTRGVREERAEYEADGFGGGVDDNTGGTYG